MFYYESHKINPKHDRIVRVEAIKSAMAAIISAIRSGPLCFGNVYASSKTNKSIRRNRMRQMASLMMEWNEVLHLYALGKAVIARTGLCRDQLSQYEAAVELRNVEFKLVSLLEANYTLELTANLDPHYRGLTELRDKIMIETERCRDKSRLKNSDSIAPPSAPRNSRHSNSRKKRLARYNSRKMSMFHAAKFASVHDEFRRVIVSRSSNDILSSVKNVKLTVRILGVSMSSMSSSLLKKKLCVLFTHHDREFRTLSKIGGSEVNWNQDFTFKIQKKESEDLRFIMMFEECDDEFNWKGILNIKNLISEAENEGKFVRRDVKLYHQQDGGESSKDFIPLKVSLKWKRRVTSQYL